MAATEQQRMRKGGKNVSRSARYASRTAAERPKKIARSRERHLKNARRSCGEKFAKELAVHYARIGTLNVPTKCTPRNR
jgi:hypothetical protein